MSHSETLLWSIEVRLIERFSVKLWMNSLAVVLSINKTIGSSFCKEIATTVFLPRSFLITAVKGVNGFFEQLCPHTQHTSASLSSETNFQGGVLPNLMNMARKDASLPLSGIGYFMPVHIFQQLSRSQLDFLPLFIGYHPQIAVVIVSIVTMRQSS